LSAIFKDQPESPLDRAVFWAEFVVRHNGAAHLRSGSRDLYWYQYYLLDVWTALLFVMYLTLLLTFKSTRVIAAMVTARKAGRINAKPGKAAGNKSKKGKKQD
jgi:glucuronosyltransferase